MHPHFLFGCAEKKMGVHGHLRAKSRRFAAVALRNAPLRLREKKSRFDPNLTQPGQVWGCGGWKQRPDKPWKVSSGCAGRWRFSGAYAAFVPWVQTCGCLSQGLLPLVPLPLRGLLSHAAAEHRCPRKTISYQRELSAHAASAGLLRKPLQV